MYTDIGVAFENNDGTQAGDFYFEEYYSALYPSKCLMRDEYNYVVMNPLGEYDLSPYVWNYYKNLF